MYKWKFNISKLLFVGKLNFDDNAVGAGFVGSNSNLDNITFINCYSCISTISSLSKIDGFINQSDIDSGTKIHIENCVGLIYGKNFDNIGGISRTTSIASGTTITNTATVYGTGNDVVNGDVEISTDSLYDSTNSIFNKSTFYDYIKGYLTKSTYTIDNVEYTNNHLIWDIENFDPNDTSNTYLVFKTGICLVENSYNYKGDGSCIYEGCDDSQACNYNQVGSCELPPENYNCAGKWTGDYCGAASACNTGSRATMYLS